MARCVICKRPKTVRGLSFHRFPKDAKILHQWLVNIGIENYVPTANSVLCSKHFTPECFEQNYVRVRLKKSSVPTLFMEENYRSSEDRPLSVSESKIIIPSSHDLHSSTESFQLHIPEIVSKNIIMQHQHEAAPLPEVIVKSPRKKLHNPKKSFQIHLPDTLCTSTKIIRLHEQFIDMVRCDHSYSRMPVNYERKIFAMHEALRKTRRSNKVLKQKVKRLQETVSSLKNMINTMLVAYNNRQMKLLSTNAVQKNKKNQAIC
ncbi:THAP domain-containing protein 1-like isoform X1 [Colletes gigas]|uniref:THAP domain-containing protein 1-like isoform X1 n=1 Tax=Colletes gigas TaxID=935657 RepID=UPI001C9B7AF1|nr:THAP domain-containing protein 1-like isoform X1 [Colletes gigas]XP_043264815.1 THAP domain-containing protein 1-like isoform X1 [Colletes gigas]